MSPVICQIIWAVQVISRKTSRGIVRRPFKTDGYRNDSN